MAVLERMKLDKLGGKSLPLYEQIRRQIKESIESNTLKAGDRLPTVASLVRQWNVDYGTVKSAFDMLAEDGLLRLEPRRGAVVVDSRQCDTFTMMYVRWGSDALAVDIADGIQDYCSEADQDFVCCDARLSHESFRNAIAHPPKDIDGLILVPLDSPEYRSAISRALKDISIVFVDRILPGISTSAVTADDFAAGCRATAHLLKQHGQPVFFFGGTQFPSSSHDRYEGWAVAMRQCNFHRLEQYTWAGEIPEDDSRTLRGAGRRQVCKELALNFLSENGHETYSVFAHNDAFAEGVYLAAEELGLVIGRDIHIVSVGDSPSCAISKPPLSSVHCSARQIGHQAAKILHHDLSGALRRPTHRMIPVELKIRASSEGI